MATTTQIQDSHLSTPHTSQRLSATPTVKLNQAAKTLLITPIHAKYVALGGRSSFLGDPVSPETIAPDGKGRFRHYQGGSIYWTSNTGAHEIHGAIRDLWATMGWEKSFLGYPLTDELQTPNGVGRYTDFQGGQIAWSAALGAGVSALFFATPGNPDGFPVPGPKSEGGSGGSPQVRRRLSAVATMHIVDDDGPDPDETGTETDSGEATLTNGMGQNIIEMEEVVDEVRVELALTAQAVDNGDVTVKGKLFLYEGVDGEETTDLEAKKNFTVLVPRDGFTSKQVKITNEDEGGDYATVEMTFNNSAI